ncbi:MAG TPA: GNAT family N-acetyltransferase [Vicinamibacterales bacterium]|nr:GNAT family N-acetyltransferase [Vicinamibacterales bacterium]
MIRLRRTTPADLDFVLALEHHPDQRSFIGQWTREQHLETMARADREHWIIERVEDEAPQGYLIAYDARDAGYGAYIKRIAIAEKSKGIGRDALREFLAHAFRDLGAASVSLAVRHHNARAQRAYAAVGFAERKLSADEWHHFRATVDPVGDDCFVMETTPGVVSRPNAT